MNKEIIKEFRDMNKTFSSGDGWIKDYIGHRFIDVRYSITNHKFKWYLFEDGNFKKMLNSFEEARRIIINLLNQ